MVYIYYHHEMRKSSFYLEILMWCFFILTLELSTLYHRKVLKSLSFISPNFRQQVLSELSSLGNLASQYVTIYNKIYPDLQNVSPQNVLGGNKTYLPQYISGNKTYLLDENHCIFTKGGGQFDTFTGPMLFCGYRPHLLIYFDEMLYGSLY